MANGQTISLKVTGDQTIHCASCENAIQRAVSMLPGVRSVKANHRTQRIEVNLDSDQTSAEQLRAKLDWMGYAVAEQ